MLNAGYVDVADYAKQGWLTGLRYEDEIFDDLIKRTKSEEDKLKKVIVWSLISRSQKLLQITDPASIKLVVDTIPLTYLLNGQKCVWSMLMASVRQN